MSVLFRVERPAKITGVAVSSAVLLERDDELARLNELIDAARAGTGAAAIVEGAAGIGKSVLLGAARDRAGERTSPC